MGIDLKSLRTTALNLNRLLKTSHWFCHYCWLTSRLPAFKWIPIDAISFDLFLVKWCSKKYHRCNPVQALERGEDCFRHRREHLEERDEWKGIPDSQLLETQHVWTLCKNKLPWVKGTVHRREVVMSSHCPGPLRAVTQPGYNTQGLLSATQIQEGNGLLLLSRLKCKRQRRRWPFDAALIENKTCA